MTQDLLNCLQGETSPAPLDGRDARPSDPTAPGQLPLHRGDDRSDAGLENPGPLCGSAADTGEAEGDAVQNGIDEMTLPPLRGPSPCAGEANGDPGLDAQRLRGHLETLYAQAAQIKDFDLQAALRDPAFVRLTAPGVGVPVADAWYALHRREEESRCAEENRRLLARAAEAGARRPREGGSGAAALLSADYRSLSREEQMRVKKRIFEASARGEKVYP